MKNGVMLAVILMGGAVWGDGLGIRVDIHRPNKKDELKVTGVVVRQVGGESPIKPGDIIVDIDNKTKINSGDDLQKWEAGANPAKTYKVNLWRQEKGKWKKRAVSVKIGAAKPANQLRPEATDEQIKAAQEKLAGRFIRTADGMLRIQADTGTVYLPATGEKTYYDFLTHTFKENGSKEVQHDKAGFYRVNGQAAEIVISSADEKLMEISKHDSLGLGFKFKDAGDTEVLISLNGKPCFRGQIKIVRLEINERDQDKDIIKEYGLPDEEKKIYVSWPKTETHDNIIYSPSAGDSIIAAKHWRWEKLPHLTVSIVDSKVYRIGSFKRRDAKELIGELRAWTDLVVTKPPSE